MNMRRVRGIDLGTVQHATPAAPPQREYDCGCGELNPANIPIRCNVHREMLRVVRDHFLTGMGWERKALWQEQDAFGKRGALLPGGGYDISALTLCSPPAIERMFRVAHGLGPINGVHDSEAS